MALVDSKSPYKTLAELTTAMKAKGAKATYATAAPTGTIMGERLVYLPAVGLCALLALGGAALSSSAPRARLSPRLSRPHLPPRRKNPPTS